MIARVATVDGVFEIDLETEEVEPGAGTVDPQQAHAGSTNVSFAPRRGNAFSFPAEAPWNGQITGTVSPSGVVVSYRLTATFDDLSCDTWQVSFNANEHSQL